MPRALAIVYAFGVSACFVDQPPPQGSTSGSSAASTSASTGTSSAPGPSTGQATADASGGTSASDTSGQGTTEPAATTTTTSTSTSVSTDATTSTNASTSSGAETSETSETSSQTGTTSTSDTSGDVDPAQCASAKDSYSCFLCCAGSFPGGTYYQKALKTCLCNQGQVCEIECASSLCLGANPNVQCYDNCLSPPPDSPCTFEASVTCMNDAACGLFLNCYGASDCGSKP